MQVSANSTGTAAFWCLLASRVCLIGQAKDGCQADKFELWDETAWNERREALLGQVEGLLDALSPALESLVLYMTSMTELANIRSAYSSSARRNRCSTGSVGGLRGLHIWSWPRSRDPAAFRTNRASDAIRPWSGSRQIRSSGPSGFSSRDDSSCVFRTFHCIDERR